MKIKDKTSDENSNRTKPEKNFLHKFMKKQLNIL